MHDYGFVHLSAGDLLRAERNSGSENGEMIDRLILEGKIVPVKVTLGLLKNAMEKSAQHLFLIDGFPRNYDNLQVGVCGLDQIGVVWSLPSLSYRFYCITEK